MIRNNDKDNKKVTIKKLKISNKSLKFQICLHKQGNNILMKNYSTKRSINYLITRVFHFQIFFVLYFFLRLKTIKLKLKLIELKKSLKFD